MGPNRNLDHLFPAFRGKVASILKGLNARPSDISWLLIEGLRSVARQRQLWAKGRTLPPIGRAWIVTHFDGVVRRSSHQSGLAADIVPTQEGRILWSAAGEVWACLGRAAREAGLVWGGDWKTLRDLPHVEWPRTDQATYNAARAWLRGRRLG